MQRMPTQTDERPAVVDIAVPAGQVVLRDGDTVTATKPPDPAFSRC